MRTILIFLFINFSTAISAQTVVNSYNLDSKKLKDFVRIGDENNKKNIFVFENESVLDVVLFDSTFNATHKLVINKEIPLYAFMGYSFKNDIYYLYWNLKSTAIEVTAIDFKNNSVKSSIIDVILEQKEKEILTYNNNGQFYILTASKETNTINAYVFSETNFNKNVLDCSSLRFIDSDSKPTTLWRFLTEDKGIIYKDGFMTFKSTSKYINPVFATQKKKTYLFKDSIIMALDVNNTFTQLLFIDLKDFTIKQKGILKDKSSVTSNSETLDSNSFIIGDKIFILKFDGDFYTILVKDFNDTLLKKFIFTGANDGSYVNSAYTEEFSGVIKDREKLENASKFISKSKNLNPSISGYFENDMYHLTIGGVSYPKQSNTLLIGAMFGLAGAIVATIIEANSQSSLQSYHNRKIVSFQSLFSSNFNRVSEKVGYSQFDAMRLFYENNETKIDYISPFEFEKDIYLIGYDKKQKKLNFHKF